MSYLNIKIPIEVFGKYEKVYGLLKEFENKFCKKDNQNFRTFHFFYEDKPSRLEIRIDSKEIDAIKEFVKNYIGDFYEVMDGNVVKSVDVQYLEYFPELKSYGNGWPIAEKIFEYCSRAAIYIRTENPDSLFRDTKFVHCFLNQLGYDSLGEAAFHNFASQQMLFKYFREQEQDPKK